MVFGAVQIIFESFDENLCLSQYKRASKLFVGRKERLRQSFIEPFFFKQPKKPLNLHLKSIFDPKFDKKNDLPKY